MMDNLRLRGPFADRAVNLQSQSHSSNSDTNDYDFLSSIQRAADRFEDEDRAKLRQNQIQQQNDNQNSMGMSRDLYCIPESVNELNNSIQSSSLSTQSNLNLSDSNLNDNAKTPNKSQYQSHDSREPPFLFLPEFDSTDALDFDNDQNFNASRDRVNRLIGELKQKDDMIQQLQEGVRNNMVTPNNPQAIVNPITNSIKSNNFNVDQDPFLNPGTTNNIYGLSNPIAGIHGLDPLNSQDNPDAWMAKILMDAAGKPGFSQIAVEAKKQQILQREAKERQMQQETFQNLERIVGAEWQDRRNLKVENQVQEMKDRLSEVKNTHRDEKLRAMLMDLQDLRGDPELQPLTSGFHGGIGGGIGTKSGELRGIIFGPNSVSGWTSSSSWIQSDYISEDAISANIRNILTEGVYDGLCINQSRQTGQIHQASNARGGIGGQVDERTLAERLQDDGTILKQNIPLFDPRKIGPTHPGQENEILNELYNTGEMSINPNLFMLLNNLHGSHAGVVQGTNVKTGQQNQIKFTYSLVELLIQLLKPIRPSAFPPKSARHALALARQDIGDSLRAMNDEGVARALGSLSLQQRRGLEKLVGATNLGVVEGSEPNQQGQGSQGRPLYYNTFTLQGNSDEQIQTQQQNQIQNQIQQTSPSRYQYGQVTKDNSNLFKVYKIEKTVNVDNKNDRLSPRNNLNTQQDNNHVMMAGAKPTIVTGNNPMAFYNETVQFNDESEQHLLDLLGELKGITGDSLMKSGNSTLGNSGLLPGQNLNLNDNGETATMENQNGIDTVGVNTTHAKSQSEQIAEEVRRVLKNEKNKNKIRDKFSKSNFDKLDKRIINHNNDSDDNGYNSLSDYYQRSRRHRLHNHLNIKDSKRSKSTGRYIGSYGRRNGRNYQQYAKNSTNRNPDLNENESNTSDIDDTKDNHDDRHKSRKSGKRGYSAAPTFTSVRKALRSVRVDQNNDYIHTASQSSKQTVDTNHKSTSLNDNAHHATESSDFSPTAGDHQQDKLSKRNDDNNVINNYRSATSAFEESGNESEMSLADAWKIRKTKINKAKVANKKLISDSKTNTAAAKLESKHKSIIPTVKGQPNMVELKTRNLPDRKTRDNGRSQNQQYINQNTNHQTVNGSQNHKMSSDKNRTITGSHNQYNSTVTNNAVTESRRSRERNSYRSRSRSKSRDNSTTVDYVNESQKHLQTNYQIKEGQHNQQLHSTKSQQFRDNLHPADGSGDSYQRVMTSSASPENKQKKMKIKIKTPEKKAKKAEKNNNFLFAKESDTDTQLKPYDPNPNAEATQKILKETMNKPAVTEIQMRSPNFALVSSQMDENIDQEIQNMATNGKDQVLKSYYKREKQEDIEEKEKEKLRRISEKAGQVMNKILMEQENNEAEEGTTTQSQAKDKTKSTSMKKTVTGNSTASAKSSKSKTEENASKSDTDDDDDDIHMEYLDDNDDEEEEDQDASNDVNDDMVGGQSKNTANDTKLDKITKDGNRNKKKSEPSKDVPGIVKKDSNDFEEVFDDEHDKSVKNDESQTVESATEKDATEGQDQQQDQNEPEVQQVKKRLSKSDIRDSEVQITAEDENDLEDAVDEFLMSPNDMRKLYKNALRDGENVESAQTSKDFIDKVAHGISVTDGNRNRRGSNSSSSSSQSQISGDVIGDNYLGFNSHAASRQRRFNRTSKDGTNHILQSSSSSSSSSKTSAASKTSASTAQNNDHLSQREIVSALTEMRVSVGQITAARPFNGLNSTNCHNIDSFTNADYLLQEGFEIGMNNLSTNANQSTVSTPASPLDEAQSIREHTMLLKLLGEDQDVCLTGNGKLKTKKSIGFLQDRLDKLNKNPRGKLDRLNEHPLANQNNSDSLNQTDLNLQGAHLSSLVRLKNMASVSLRAALGAVKLENVSIGSIKIMENELTSLIIDSRVLIEIIKDVNEGYDAFTNGKQLNGPGKSNNNSNVNFISKNVQLLSHSESSSSSSSNSTSSSSVNTPQNVIDSEFLNPSSQTQRPSFGSVLHCTNLVITLLNGIGRRIINEHQKPIGGVNKKFKEDKKNKNSSNSNSNSMSMNDSDSYMGTVGFDLFRICEYMIKDLCGYSDKGIELFYPLRRPKGGKYDPDQDDDMNEDNSEEINNNNDDYDINSDSNYTDTDNEAGGQKSFSMIGDKKGLSDNIPIGIAKKMTHVRHANDAPPMIFSDKQLRKTLFSTGKQVNDRLRKLKNIRDSGMRDKFNISSGKTQQRSHLHGANLEIEIRYWMDCRDRISNLAEILDDIKVIQSEVGRMKVVQQSISSPVDNWSNDFKNSESARETRMQTFKDDQSMKLQFLRQHMGLYLGLIERQVRVMEQPVGEIRNDAQLGSRHHRLMGPGKNKDMSKKDINVEDYDDDDNNYDIDDNAVPIHSTTGKNLQQQGSGGPSHIVIRGTPGTIVNSIKRSNMSNINKANTNTQTSTTRHITASPPVPGQPHLFYSENADQDQYGNAIAPMSDGEVILMSSNNRNLKQQQSLSGLKYTNFTNGYNSAGEMIDLDDHHITHSVSNPRTLSSRIPTTDLNLHPHNISNESNQYHNIDNHKDHKNHLNASSLRGSSDGKSSLTMSLKDVMRQAQNRRGEGDIVMNSGESRKIITEEKIQDDVNSELGIELENNHFKSNDTTDSNVNVSKSSSIPNPNNNDIHGTNYLMSMSMSAEKTSRIVNSINSKAPGIASKNNGAGKQSPDGTQIPSLSLNGPLLNQNLNQNLISQERIPRAQANSKTSSSIILGGGGSGSSEFNSVLSGASKISSYSGIDGPGTMNNLSSSNTGDLNSKTSTVTVNTVNTSNDNTQGTIATSKSVVSSGVEPKTSSPMLKKGSHITGYGDGSKERVGKKK